MVGSKNKCYICSKKLNLIQLEVCKCRCKNNFCELHRFPETHNCSEIKNIINVQREKLRLTLEKVDNSKVIKI
jgi:predicted nucleic acid binding AN1-type Zn finger protein